MKKRFLWLMAILLTVILTFGLTACDDEEGSDDGYEDDGGDYSGSSVTVTYFTELGGTPINVTVTNGRFTLSPIPQKEGYIFTGLFDNPTGGSCIVDAYGGSQVTFTKPVTLYAQWVPKTYTVIFNPSGGSMEGSDTVTVTYGAGMPILPKAEKPGYEFLGWTDNVHGLCSNGVSVLTEFATFNSQNYLIQNETVTLYAEFREKKLTVTFDYNDGSYQTDKLTMKYGDTIGAGSYPQMDTGSRVITGWSLNRSAQVDFSGVVTEDITLYAIWKDYKVFNLHLGNGDLPLQVKLFKGDYYSFERPTWNGYEFDGWYASTLFAGVPLTSIGYSSAETDFYAKWIPLEYTLHLEVGDGTRLPDLSYTIKDSVKLPAASREFCTFVGWCFNADLSDTPFTTLPSGYFGELTLYAKFRGEDRVVLPDACGGILAQKQVTVEFGNPYQLPVPMKEGYLFVGWYDGAGVNANRLTDENGKSLGNYNFTDAQTTVYAHYSKKYFVRVEYSLPEGGSVAVSEYYANGWTVAPKLTLNAGYVFEGYYIDNILVSTDPTYTFLMEGMDVTLEVRISAREYQFTLNADGGFCQQTTATVTHGKDFLLPVVWKQGYLFNGWTFNGQLVTDQNGKSLESWSKEVIGTPVLKATFVVDPQGESFIVVKDRETFLTMLQFPDKTYSLTADIDLGGITWNPVEFKGALYGNNFTLKNLTIVSSAQNVGLFTVLKGTVRDLRLENVTVKSEGYNGNAFVGVICGTLSGGKIENVTVVSGAITSGISHTGGIAGYVLNGSTVSGCINYAAINSAPSKDSGATGGIVGHIPANAAVTLTDCTNHGPITSTYRVGGGVGALYENINIVNVTNTADVTATGTGVGGIVGRYQVSHSGTLDLNWKAVNKGAVTGGDGTGGIIGEAYYNFSGYATMLFNDSVNEGSVTGNLYVGGIVGYAYYNSTNNEFVVTVTGQKNYGNVTGANNVGGIYGYLYTDSFLSVLKGSSSSAVINGGYYVGGIVGKGDNLYIDSCSNKGSVINITGFYLSSSTYYTWAGGIAGYTAFVSNCKNESPITLETEGYYIGGIAGYVTRGTMNCENSGDIYAPKCDAVGGIAGASLSSAVLLQQNLTNKGSVTGKKYVGGVYGFMNEETSGNPNQIVTDLRNEGNIVGVDCVGGVIGSAYSNSSNGNVLVTFSNWHSVGNVTGDTNVGGVVGKLYSDYNISRLENASAGGVISGRYRLGGIVGLCENVVLDSCSNDGCSIVVLGAYLEGTVYRSYVGGIAGYGFSILNSVNRAEILILHEGYYVGGVVGYCLGVVQSCENLAEVNAPKSDFVGGIAGYVKSTSSEGHHHLTNQGNVTGRDYTGGVFGNLENTYAYDMVQPVEDVANSGTVVGDDYVGGIVGRFYYNASNGSSRLLATRWQNLANVTGTSNVGGLVGYGETDHAESVITSSSSCGEIKAQHMVGGLMGKAVYFTIDSCSNAGSTVTATGVGASDTYGGHVNMGGYVGHGHNVYNCDNAVSLTISYEGNHIGGIAGYLTGSLENCTNSGVISAPKGSFVGGIAGRTYSSYDSVLPSFKKLTNTAAVTGKSFVGGVMGSNETNCKYGGTELLEDLVNSGKISGTDTVGGIAGNVYSYSSNSEVIWTATRWKNTGDVTGTFKVGGLIGVGSAEAGSSKLISCSSAAKISADYYLGGLGGYVDYITMESCTNEGSEINVTGYFLENSVYYTYVGGYAGRGYRFVDCVNSVEIKVTQKGSYVGGLAGIVTGNYCGNSGSSKNTAAVTAKNCDYVGGLFGHITTATSTEMKELVNEGSVEGKSYVGGIAGYLHLNGSGALTLNVTDLSNAGAVKCDTTYVGGLFGYLYANSSNSTCVFSGTNWKNTGSVEGDHLVGGLIGAAWTDGDSKLQNSSSVGTITAKYYVGGLAGKLENVEMNACSNKGTVLNVTGYLLDNSLYYTYAGGYAGYGYRFVSCENHAEISLLNKGAYVGGIAGYAYSYANSCTNSANIQAPNCEDVGGIYGYYNYGGSTTMTDLTNTADVEGKTRVGGIFGYYYTYGSGVITLNLTSFTNEGKITASGDYAGGIAGRFNGDSSNNNCTFLGTEWENKGDITGNAYVGGLLGQAWIDYNGSKLQESSSSGTIQGKYLVGGLAGEIWYTTFFACSNTGTKLVVTGSLLENSNYYIYAGGYAGKGYAFTDCINYAAINIPQKGMYVGGIAGYAQADVISCWNYHPVNAPNATYVGGIIGRMECYAGLTMSGLMNEAEIVGKEHVGGLVGSFYLNLASARDVILTDLFNKRNVTASGDYAGGIMGYYYGNSTNSNCTLKATELKNIGNITGNMYVGGLFGYGYDDYSESKIEESSSSGAIKGLCYVGGLAGKLEYIQVLSCSNEGSTVTATGSELVDDTHRIYLGGYLGYGYTIKGCVNDVSLSCEQKGSYVGGIAGYLVGTVSDCENNGTIYAPKATRVAGVIGAMSVSSAITVSELKNNGSITGADHVGGVVGYYHAAFSGAGAPKILSCTNTGAIVATGDYVGGVFGRLYAESTNNNCTLTVIELKNTGSVTGNMYVGGLIGYGYADYAESKIEASTSSGAVKGLCYVGGLAGKLDYIQILSCSNEGSTVTATGSELVDGDFSIYVGGYVGRGLTVKDCVNKVNITCAQQGMYVGGIAGYLTYTASDCENHGKISAPNASRVGGIVGAINPTAASTMSNLKNSGEVTGATRIGGVIGMYYLNINGAITPKISGFTNTAKVTASGDYAGGLVGYFYAISANNNCTLTATELKNTGDVTGNMYVGGLMGYAYDDYTESKLEASTSSGAVKGLCYVGGLFGQIQYIKVINCSNAGSSVSASGYLLENNVYYGFVGGYAGYGYYFSDCVNEITIVYTGGGQFVGGIAGYCEISIEKCQNKGEIKAVNSSYVGGIVGRVGYTNTTPSILNCSNSGAITGKSHVGGIIGEYYLDVNSDRVATFSALTNSGAVTSLGDFAGGIIGRIYANASSNAVHLKMTELKNNGGQVMGLAYVGGLVGYGYSDASDSYMEACTSTNAYVQGSYYVGGLGGYLYPISMNNCSNEGSTITATGSVLVDNSYYAAYLGGYAGYGSAATKCENKSSLNYVGEGAYVGGIMGFAVGNLTECKNSGNISAVKSNYVGGIAGYCSNTGSAAHKTLTNTGSVKGMGHVGGLFGMLKCNTSSGSTLTLSALTNEGSVRATEEYAGGLFGELYANASSNSCTVTATAFTNTGNVVGTKTVGGLIGKFYSDTSASTLTGYSSTGGVTASEGTSDALIATLQNLVLK